LPNHSNMAILQLANQRILSIQGAFKVDFSYGFWVWDLRIINNTLLFGSHIERKNQRTFGEVRKLRVSDISMMSYKYCSTQNIITTEQRELFCNCEMQS
jgi:hypothetical protein